MKKLILIIACEAMCYVAQAQTNYTQYVNPMVGTGGHGHTFPGATVPFGMVQLSPDTRIDGSWDGCSGYHYSDSIIYGFSHTHLSGTGVSDYGDILLMPVTGKASFDQKVYASRFSHANELAKAGYYSVLLDNGVFVQLTATKRVGFHQYAFPKGSGSVILDLTHRDELIEGSIHVVNNTTLAVKRRSRAWAVNQHAYAFIVFSSPFKTIFNPEKTKVILSFSLKPKETLLIKTGFSLVSEAGAQNNLMAELPHWDFEQTKTEAEKSWNMELGKIHVEDKKPEKLRTFYTALYHTMIHPNIAMDVDGHYRGRHDVINLAIDFNYYTVFSLWDTFRAAHPLYALIDRKRVTDYIRTFLRQYEEGGRLPVWELASNETDCMIGYHSVSVMADALAKGINDFDVDLAFEAMKKSATWNHLGLPEYMKHGFLSIDDEHESVSKTLEYAYDDWCIAQVAKRLKKEQDYQYYMNRSNAWENLLDSETKLMRPRKNGDWLKPFDPREVNNHFTEGNSWQYSFFVPHDIEGMISKMGGPELFEAKLDELFTTSSQTTGRTQSDITGLIGQYAHGNEPSHHMAFLYNYIGKPEKTKYRVHQILKEFYTDQPDGLIGNEDCGQMSAWYVLSAMGLYAVTPGSDQYTLTEPFLDDFTIYLESGKTIAKKNITNALQRGLFISHSVLTGEENTSVPLPSKVKIDYVAAPVISAGSISFKDSLKVEIYSTEKNKIEYIVTLEGGRSTRASGVPVFYVKENCTVTAKAVKEEGGTRNESKTVQAKFYKTPHPEWKLNLISKYNPQYSAGGPEGLIDGIKGTENWRKGDWQGFQDQDFEVILEFDKTKQINGLSARFLQDTRSWILMPKKVEFYISDDGVNFKLSATVYNSLAADDYTVQIKDFTASLDVSVTSGFVKVKAYNFGKLPEWHQGAGYPAFIFVDEIEIK